ncbi:hypothetical protein [Paraburkholderia sacchari]|uniref:hypothetical protein n=1 Tax=Paraburkholderia sacchari TaxID=159450 RepID=UPI003144E6B1
MLPGNRPREIAGIAANLDAPARHLAGRERATAAAHGERAATHLRAREIAHAAVHDDRAAIHRAAHAIEAAQVAFKCDARFGIWRRMHTHIEKVRERDALGAVPERQARDFAVAQWGERGGQERARVDAQRGRRLHAQRDALHGVSPLPQRRCR